MGSSLYEISHHWRGPLAVLSSFLLITTANTCETNRQLSFRAGAAFLMLPGIIHHIRIQKEIRVVDFLRDTVGIEDPGQCINAVLKMAVQCKETQRTTQANTEPRERRQISQGQLVKKVEGLVAVARTSAAMRPCAQLASMIDRGVTREDTTIPLSIDETKNIIEDLFPRAEPDDQLFPVDDDAPLLATFTGEDVRSVILKLPVGSAAGVSGWTYRIIRQITLQPGNHGVVFCDSIAKLFNKFAVGAIDRRLWTAIRNVMIPQPGKPKPRPLGIGDALLRIFGRCVLRQLGTEIGAQLMPLQFGVGVKSGCEIAARLAQVALDAHQEQVIIPMDLANAFNSIPNRAMQQGVNKFAPALKRFFFWMYGQPNEIVTSTGEVVGTREVGASQGDTLASLFFSLGFHRTLDRCATAVKDISEPRIGITRQGAVWAYIDDFTATCHADLIIPVIKKVAEILAEEGFSLSVKNCSVVGEVAAAKYAPATSVTVHLNEETAAKRQHPTGLCFAVEKEGTKVLGAPAGTKAFRQSFVAQKMESMVQPVPALGFLTTQVSFKLLKDCIIARASYIVRVTNPADNNESCKQFDAAVDAALLEIMGVSTMGEQSSTSSNNNNINNPSNSSSSSSSNSNSNANNSTTKLEPTDRLLLQRNLATSLGGFGMARYGDIVGEKAAVQSRALVRTYVHDHYDETGSASYLTPGVWGLEPIHVGEGSNYHELARLPSLRTTGSSPHHHGSNNGPGTPDSAEAVDGEDMGGEHDPASSPIDTPTDLLKGISHNYQAKVTQALLSHLRSSGQKAEAAWFLSLQHSGSGWWLNRPAECYHSFRLKAETYREALRQRAMIPFLFGRELPPQCTCGKLLPNAGDAAFHLLHCPHSGWYVTKRHNCIRDALCKLLEDIGREPNSEVSDVSKEVPIAAPPPENAVYTADIMVRVNNMLHAVDVTVANPAAETYLALQSHMDVEVATRSRGESKKALYARIRCTNQFIPFALDATGRLGKCAQKFVDKITSGHPNLRRSFLDNVIFLCTAVNAINIARRSKDEHFCSSTTSSIY